MSIQVTNRWPFFVPGVRAKPHIYRSPFGLTLNQVADGNTMSKRITKDTRYNATREDGKSRFKAGNPGRPKGVKNKLSFQAAERMEQLGLDPLQGYVELLMKARATNNLAVEERALSRLMQFRFAGLHHSMVTNVDEKDLEVSVTKFEMPAESTGKGDEANDKSSKISNHKEEMDIKSEEIGVNVTKFRRSSP